MEQHERVAASERVEVRYEYGMRDIIRSSSGAVSGVTCDTPDGQITLNAGAVVLAAGGFEANPRLRAAYLGPHWDLARVRGTPFNTGEALEAAIRIGATPYGNWSGCHATAWDVGGPRSFGDRELTNLLTKQSYPLGLIVNNRSERFVDEGADFRNYTYAKYGAAILGQPEAQAFQLFDAQTEPLLRQDEYTHSGVARFQADTISGLALLLGIDPGALESTVRTFNDAVQPGAFNPAIKDGKRTAGIEPPKSNWALPLHRPPFVGFAVTCGITFTFGGLLVDSEARALDAYNRPIPGLTVAGEMVGGLFFDNYPGGSGLSSGVVFGRRAGLAAAREVA
jgi:tricarballylate dehydrogenase